MKSKFNFDNHSHSHKITQSTPSQNLVASQNKQTEVCQGQKSRQQVDNTSFTNFETNKNNNFSKQPAPQLRHASYSHTDAIDIRKNMQEQNDFLRDQQAFIREIQKNKENNNNNIKMPHPASKYLHYSTKPPMKPFLKPVVDYANVHVASKKSSQQQSSASSSIPNTPKSRKKKQTDNNKTKNNSSSNSSYLRRKYYNSSSQIGLSSSLTFNSTQGRRLVQTLPDQKIQKCPKRLFSAVL